MNNPYILKETDDYAVVFKPPKMHCTVLNKEQKQGLTLMEWCNKNISQFFDIMHRLDFETHGLVLIAKNEKTYNFFKIAQDRDEFIKEYSAICVPKDKNNYPEGFPENNFLLEKSSLIKSYFRPYGPGRKLVRPIIEDEKKHKEIAKDKGGFYTTEIININGNVLTVKIKRGFRHQIRCHLCWIGFPIKNDPLYLNPINQDVLSENIMALRSHALIFPDPLYKRQCEYRIEALLEPEDF
jgi:23S rRNA pseudouridine1911/1915/1917 synthase